MAAFGNPKYFSLQSISLLFGAKAFHFVAFRITLILVNIYSANSISFNITCFGENNDIVYKGDAYARDHAIRLTGGSQVQTNLNGRAMYKEPMHLWDNATRQLTDFSTSFSFAEEYSGNEYFPGGALSFFLTTYGSTTLPNSNSGFHGRVTGDDNSMSSTADRFVAVELYNYLDPMEPNVEHVGIKINSTRSEKTMIWSSSTAKKSFSVLVEYNSSTRYVSVTLIDQSDSTALIEGVTIGCQVDLQYYLPEWVTIGFSASAREFTRTYSIYTWQFSSSLKAGSEAPNFSDRRNKKKKMNPVLVLGTVIGASGTLVLIWVLILLWLFLHRKRDAGSQNGATIIIDNSIEDELARSGSGPKRFSYSELEQATNNFAEEGKLGQGGFGDVYRGLLIMSNVNMDVAVKRFNPKGSKQGKKEYKSEVTIISSLRHRNLVQLIGWCHERGEFLLVYEFMPNGSLDSHLFSQYSKLSWEIRCRIVLGLASALLYLHEGWEQCVVHRDIKPSNVMLDISFNTKLGDFGLARLIDHELGPKTTGLAGTFGYMAPEYISTGKASKESDMFSFGVVILEIASGRRAVEPGILLDESHEMTIVAWVWALYGRDSLVDAADHRLLGDFEVEQLKRLMALGLWCAYPDHRLRPSIRQAIQVLNYEAEIPNLPRTMPVPIYNVPNSSSTSSSEAFMTLTSANLGR